MVKMSLLVLFVSENTMKKRLCKSNKEALRWCANRAATIEFKGEADKSYCKVWLGKRRYKDGSTLLNTVNLWIKHFNKDIISG